MRDAIGMTYLLVVLIVPIRAPGDEWDRAFAVREQCSLSPADLAALDVDVASQQELATLVRSYVRTVGENDGALLHELGAAHDAIRSAASTGRGQDAAYTRLRAARLNVVGRFAPMMAEAVDGLPDVLDGAMNRAIANGGVDSPYRLLSLTEGQRTAILEAQKRRDSVLLDARQWHRGAHLEAVRQQFDADVAAVLTQRQRAELAALQANIAANGERVWQVDLADFPVPPPPPAEADPFAAAGQGKPAFAWNWDALARFARTFLSRWSAWSAAVKAQTMPPVAFRGAARQDVATMRPVAADAMQAP